MFAFVPGDSFAHRLDPRSKLLVQAAFAAAAYAHTTPGGLAVLSALAVGCVRAAGGSVREVAWGYRWAAPFLLTAPLIAGATLGAPWFRPDRAARAGLACYRVAGILLGAGAYGRPTPVRDSRAAVQRTVPGKTGQFLGIGVGLVFRFLPLLRRDLVAAREGMHARGGEARSLRERVRIVAVAGLDRAFGRADRLALALNARCLAWNPTLPRLRFRRRDVPAVALAAALFVAAVVPFLRA